MFAGLPSPSLLEYNKYKVHVNTKCLFPTYVFLLGSQWLNTNEEQDDTVQRTLNMEDIMTSIKMRSCIGKYFINCKVL